jgi:F-box/WD-40 domain protein MET30
MCLQYHTALTNPSYPVLITGSYDRTVRVWNLDSGTEVRVLRGHSRAVRALQFDQMLLFTGSMDGTVRMWNWRAGECLRVLEGHTDGVVSLNYNGYLLASGSADSTIQVWNFRTGDKFILHGHDEWVNSVVLWDGKTSPGDIDPTQMPSFTRHRTSLSPGPTPTETPKGPDIDDRAMLFSSSDDGTIKLWDLVQQTCIRTFEGHKAQVQSLRVIMVDMTEEEIVAAYRQASRRDTPPRSAFTPVSQSTLSTSPPRSIGATGPQSIQLDNAPDGFDPNAYRSRSREAAVEPRVYVHTPSDTAGKTKEDKGEGKGTQRKALLASGGLDGTVKLWDVDTGTERSTLFGYVGMFLSSHLC